MFKNFSHFFRVKVREESASVEKMIRKGSPKIDIERNDEYFLSRRKKKTYEGEETKILKQVKDMRYPFDTKGRGIYIFENG